MPGLEGTRLGRYRLQQRLGHGGMSEVYLAYDELMHRDIAIKVMSSTHADYIERFQREAEAIGNLHHNHILPAFDYGHQEPWHYLVMPYIDHESLSELLDRGPLTLEHAGEMLSQIASALQHAHEHGILHRDIKPSNILLRDDHYAYLADFGLAKAMDGSGSVTHTGVLMGTPEYMAPELADGLASTSSDLYALGILLYQMVTGRLPFTGDTALAVYLRQMHEQPLPPSRLNPTISQDVEQVILRTLDKDPRRRFQTPNGLAQAYQEALNAKVPLRDIIPSRTPTPRAGVAMSDSGEMPPLYNKTSAVEDELAQAHGSRYALAEPYYSDRRVPEADSIFDSASSVAAQEEKLVLPAYSLHANAAASISADQTIIQQPSSLPSNSPIRRPVRPTNLHDARHNRNSFMVTSLMGISFLLIIMSVILFAVFAYSSNRQTERIRTLTAQAMSTNQANRAGGKQPKGTPATRTGVTRLSPQQVPLATANAITSAAPALQDDLSTDFIGGWYVDNTSCTFAGGAYHVIVKQANFLQTCESSTFSFDNAALQVDVSLLSGSNAGLIFRASDQRYYDFGIDNQGDYFFRRHDSNGAGGGTITDLIPGTRSSAIAPGKRKNTLLVIANGSDFKLFINRNFVGEQQDSSYIGGQVGFGVGTLPSVNTGEASFSNFKEYLVPS
jgi:eukaryotic-like serine/threonine-protein kinase